MRAIPLFPRESTSPFVSSPSLRRNSKCTLCALSQEKPESVCMLPEVPPMPVGGCLLVVGEHPGSAEDAAGKPFQGEAGLSLRKKIASLWKGPVVYDSAIKCYAPQGREIEAEEIEACRPYLSYVIERVKPR